MLCQLILQGTDKYCQAAEAIRRCRQQHDQDQWLCFQTIDLVHDVILCRLILQGTDNNNQLQQAITLCQLQAMTFCRQQANIWSNGRVDMLHVVAQRCSDQTCLARHDFGHMHLAHVLECVNIIIVIFSSTGTQGCKCLAWYATKASHLHWSCPRQVFALAVALKQRRDWVHATMLRLSKMTYIIARAPALFPKGHLVCSGHVIPVYFVFLHKHQHNCKQCTHIINQHLTIQLVCCFLNTWCVDTWSRFDVIMIITDYMFEHMCWVRVDQDLMCELDKIDKPWSELDVSRFEL